MIRDPGGASPNENQDSPPSPKYDRILGRPPPALDETEIPLDMTVRRKDSSDGQGSPTALGDGPINLNVRPSVITKAPPQPIKKRISHMHNNGEIVLKSSIRTTTTTQSSTTVESAPIVNVSATYCDVSIEEHFRRSLGPTYSSIYGDKQQLQQQPLLNVLNNNTSQPGAPPFSPERALAPPVLQPSVHPLPLPLLLQQQHQHQKQHTAMETSDSPPLVGGPVVVGAPPVGMRNHSSSSISSSSSVTSNSSLSSSSSTSSTSSSSTSTSSSNTNATNNNNNNISIRSMRVVAPDTIELKRSSDPTPPVPLVPATVLPPSPGAPSGSAASVAIALTSPKHLHQPQAAAAPPAPPPQAISPAVSLSATTMSLGSSSPSSSLAPSPAPPHVHQPKPGEEVDDHFAKALGETWKKIQESNMNL